MSTVTKEWKKEEIKELLEHNDEAVYRAIVRIHRRQTPDEQRCHSTVQSNGVGFSAFDAEILSSFAERIHAWNQETTHQYTKPLSPRQLVVGRKKIKKYARQLAEIANGKDQ